MKVAVSYSFGKDSTLALHRICEQGHTPVALIVMVNPSYDRSWFHGVDHYFMERIGEVLRIPLICCETEGETYHTALEDGIRRAKQLGIQACVFGDIDIEEHALWCRERCRHTSVQPLFPLWHHPRKELVQEVIDLGYQARIKCIRNDLLPESLLGKTLDRAIIQELENSGVDVCGENGEYHTLVTDGPLFHHPVATETGEILQFGKVSAVELRALPEERGSSLER